MRFKSLVPMRRAVFDILRDVSHTERVCCSECWKIGREYGSNLERIQRNKKKMGGKVEKKWEEREASNNKQRDV